MQVSNSTGHNTDYRVASNSGSDINMPAGYAYGGAQEDPGEVVLGAANGCLPPGESASLSSGGPCWIEFWVDGTMVASGSFNEDPGLLELVDEDGQYAIRVQAANAA